MIKQIFVAGLVVVSGIAILQAAGPSPQPPQPKTVAVSQMTEHEHKAFVSMTAEEAQAYINADGESCPLVTTGTLRHFPDSGAPVWNVSCTDGSRYYVFWRGDIGRIKALSY